MKFSEFVFFQIKAFWRSLKNAARVHPLVIPLFWINNIDYIIFIYIKKLKVTNVGYTT